MHERARFAGILASVAVVYILAGVVGLSFAHLHPVVTPIWPSAGIAVAALLVVGLRAWPAVAIGAFITNLIVLRDGGLSAAIAAGNTLECVGAAALTMRVARGRLAFERGPDVFRFAFVAGIVAPLIAAAVGTATLRGSDQIAASDTWSIWLTWWLGDATGIALYAPLGVLLTTRQPVPRAGRMELATLAGALVLVLFVAFGVPEEVQRDIPLAIVILPLMLWSAFRVGILETAGLGVIMSGVAVYRSRAHVGPFELGGPESAPLMAQSLVTLISLLMLAVAAETAVRRRVESKLLLLNETLERRVHDRTAQLTRMHDRLAEAQSVAQVGSWEWDLATDRWWWSDEFSRIFAVSEVPSSYDAYLALIHPDDRERTDAELKRAIHEGHPLTFEHRIIRPDGDERVVHARGHVAFDAAGAPRRLLVTGHDITERLRAEAARAQLAQEQRRLREAEEANRAKDDFLATLSHELRTPLNAALGWTHILRDSLHADHRHGRVVQAIYRNLQLQSRIVSDILDIARITKGELPLEEERVDMRAVFEAAVDMVREVANARSVTVDIHSVGSAHVRGDSRRLQQVAWNLLSNAVKFTPARGAVTVSILEGADRVECSVEDEGPGIAPSFLPHVFEQFRQADSSTTREHGGLGLGLAIAHEIVAMHGGEISAGNRATGGAVFVVRLPKSDASAVAEGTAPRSESHVRFFPRAPTV